MCKVWLRMTVVESKAVELLVITCWSTCSRLSALTDWDALCGWLAGFLSKWPLAVAMALGICFATNLMLTWCIGLFHWWSLSVLRSWRWSAREILGTRERNSHNPYRCACCSRGCRWVQSSSAWGWWISTFHAFWLSFFTPDRTGCVSDSWKSWNDSLLKTAVRPASVKGSNPRSVSSSSSLLNMNAGRKKGPICKTPSLLILSLQMRVHLGSPWWRWSTRVRILALLVYVMLLNPLAWSRFCTYSGRCAWQPVQTLVEWGCLHSHACVPSWRLASLATGQGRLGSDDMVLRPPLYPH
jgi:hypothetical protein